MINSLAVAGSPAGFHRASSDRRYSGKAIQPTATALPFLHSGWIQRPIDDPAQVDSRWMHPTQRPSPGSGGTSRTWPLSFQSLTVAIVNWPLPRPPSPVLASILLKPEQ